MGSLVRHCSHVQLPERHQLNIAIWPLGHSDSSLPVSEKGRCFNLCAPVHPTLSGALL
jgi:hypothetical protein